MQKIKFLLSTFIVILIVLCVGIVPVYSSSDELYLNNLDFNAKINEDGSMNVTETWDIYINEINTLYKTFNSINLDNISDIMVTDITKGKTENLTQTDMWEYHLEKGKYFYGLNDKNIFEISWGVGLDNSSETRKYEVSYKIKDAVSKYSDYAELYWKFVGEDFAINAANITGTILLHSNVSNIENFKVWGHTQDLNGEIYVTDSNKIEFKVKGYKEGNFVEVRTLFPTEMISSVLKENRPILNEVINEETKWAEEANARREARKTLEMLSATTIAIVSLGITIVIVRSIIKNSKNAKTLKKLKVSKEIIYFREIPRQNATPTEALYLYQNRYSEFSQEELGRVVSSTFLDLSLKKIIEFEVTKDNKNKDSIKIKILNENPTELENILDQKRIFQFLKGACKGKKEITIKEFEKYIKIQPDKIIKLKEDIDNVTKIELLKKDLLNKDGKDSYDDLNVKITGYTILLFLSSFISILVAIEFNAIVLIGAIPLIVTTLFNLLLLMNMRKKTNVFTQRGIDEANEWKGVKKYMEEFSLLDQKEVPQIVIWEKFLVFATVFNIADKVLKQLKVVYPNIENSIELNNYAYMYLMLNTNFSKSFSNSISTSMSTAYSSATGGGGGFSGGGGGGRWPEVEEEVDNTSHSYKINIFREILKERVIKNGTR